MRWRPRIWHLLASWLLYWIALFLVAFRRPLLTWWRVTRNPQGHGTASFEFSGSPVTVALYVLGPPALFWACWLFLRSRAPASR
jgi:hypothetical protein